MTYFNLTIKKFIGQSNIFFSYAVLIFLRWLIIWSVTIIMNCKKITDHSFHQMTLKAEKNFKKNKIKCNFWDFCKGPGEFISVHCIRCNRNAKNKMSQHAMKYVCGNLIFVIHGYECSSQKTKLLNETKIEVVLDNIQHYLEQLF